MTPRAVWPGHAAPRHTGWKIWCRTCRGLKAQVDALSGRTRWESKERLVPKGFSLEVVDGTA